MEFPTGWKLLSESLGITNIQNYQHSELPIFGIFNRNTECEPGYGLRYGLGYGLGYELKYELKYGLGYELKYGLGYGLKYGLG